MSKDLTYDEKLEALYLTVENWERIQLLFNDPIVSDWFDKYIAALTKQVMTVDLGHDERQVLVMSTRAVEDLRNNIKALETKAKAAPKMIERILKRIENKI